MKITIRDHRLFEKRISSFFSSIDRKPVLVQKEKKGKECWITRKTSIEEEFTRIYIYIYI